MLAVLSACKGNVPDPEQPSADSSLTGTEVQMPEIGSSAKKLFVLNEGSMGANNASLDFLRFSDGNYITQSFRKMNPLVATGIGDVGNDIAVHGDELWIVINNSGLVEVVSAADETEIAAIQVPTPRNIAFDGKYAYVTSWAGAYAVGQYDENGKYSISDSKNPRGQVYRINLSTKELEGSVQVGYQPEGIASYDGKLYVANSGGISSQLPPSYSYDNTVSVIDAASFRVVQTVEVEVNLKNVHSDGRGTIYVTSFGDYWNIHSGLYAFSAANPAEVRKIDGAVFQEGATNVSCSFLLGDTVYCIGTPDEFDWSKPRSYSLWSVTTKNASQAVSTVSFYPFALSGTPYGLAVAGENPGLLFVGDAGDYFNPGTVSCYRLDDGEPLWKVNAGVCPGHFALY